jgi:uncharacterized protein (UPF0248 family)
MTEQEARKLVFQSATRIYPNGFELIGWIEAVEMIDNEVYFIYAGFGKYRVHHRVLEITEGGSLIFRDNYESPIKKGEQLQLF